MDRRTFGRILHPHDTSPHPAWTFHDVELDEILLFERTERFPTTTSFVMYDMTVRPAIAPRFGWTIVDIHAMRRIPILLEDLVERCASELPTRSSDVRTVIRKCFSRAMHCDKSKCLSRFGKEECLCPCKNCTRTIVLPRDLESIKKHSRARNMCLDSWKTDEEFDAMCDAFRSYKNLDFEFEIPPSMRTANVRTFNSRDFLAWCGDRECVKTRVPIERTIVDREGADDSEVVIPDAQRARLHDILEAAKMFPRAILMIDPDEGFVDVNVRRLAYKLETVCGGYKFEPKNDMTTLFSEDMLITENELNFLDEPHVRLIGGKDETYDVDRALKFYARHRDENSVLLSGDGVAFERIAIEMNLNVLTHGERVVLDGDGPFGHLERAKHLHVVPKKARIFHLVENYDVVLITPQKTRVLARIGPGARFARNAEASRLKDWMGPKVSHVFFLCCLETPLSQLAIAAKYAHVTLHVAFIGCNSHTFFDAKYSQRFD